MSMTDIKIKNRKANFEFEILDKLTAGIQLRGTEIKSLRNGNASITEAFCQVKGDEMFVVNMHIAEYEMGTDANHLPKRERKLLLHKRETISWKKKVNEKGLTIIPTLLYINKEGLAKLNIALAQGKKIHDKRHSIREKDSKRELDRLKKMHYSPFCAVVSKRRRNHLA
ncbi:MAG: SsrA-binding protein SmpB [Salibacteraceae bacterium]